jgi:hypothetical protein
VTNALNQVDLAFVVDTTGSMGPFIRAARHRMTAMLWSLTGGGTAVSLRLWVVEYRDHPPQDPTFVARTHPGLTDLAQAQQVIAGLRLGGGGGDGPEAVYDGLAAACALAWRPHSRRLAVLVGDSPPHGSGTPRDNFPNGCPCGLTTERVTAMLEQQGVTLYALGLTAAVTQSFGRLAAWTGGEYFEPGQGEKAIEALRGVLAGEFENIDLDRRVMEECRRDGWTIDGLGEALASGRTRIAASLSRLGRRGLLGRPA